MTYRCTGGFAFYEDGTPRVYGGGVLVADSDPILTTHGAHFERAEDFTDRRAALPRSAGAAVETATAAPGERRMTSKPAAATRRTRAVSDDTSDEE